MGFKFILEKFMYFKKSLFLVVSFIAVSSAFAAEAQKGDSFSNEEKIGLDLFITSEGAIYNNFKLSNLDFKYPSGFRTGSLQASALYALSKSDLGSPVVGGGLDFYYGVYNNILTTNGSEINGQFWMGSLILKAIGGYKFTPTNRFSVYTLANVGYGVANYAQYKSVPLNNSSKVVDENITVNNHISYGANAIAAFQLTNTLGLGFGLGLTGHSMSLNSNALNVDQSLNYVDVNSSLSLIFTL
jgi:hypothetical protein